MSALPKLYGLVRDAGNANSVALVFERPLTDNELRLLHESLRMLTQEARTPGRVASVVGTMTFMRSKPPSECVCCPDGKEKGHAFARYLKLENESERAVGDWLNESTWQLASEGDRVRVNIEVLR